MTGLVLFGGHQGQKPIISLTDKKKKKLKWDIFSRLHKVYPVESKALTLELPELHSKRDASNVLKRTQQHLPHYIIQDYIIYGAFGQVLKAQSPDGRLVAIKTNEGQPIRALREASFMKLAAGPGVTEVYHFCIVGKFSYLMSPLAIGCLRSLLDNSGPLSYHQGITFTKQLLGVLHHINIICSILHRDIKPENVLIFPNLKVCLTDFDLAVTYTVGSELIDNRSVGSPRYIAPESILNGRYSHGSDIFGLGATMYEMFTGKYLFKAQDLESLRSPNPRVNPVLQGIDKKHLPKSLPKPVAMGVKMMCCRESWHRQPARVVLHTLEENLQKHPSGCFSWLLDVVGHRKRQARMAHQNEFPL